MNIKYGIILSVLFLSFFTEVFAQEADLRLDLAIHSKDTLSIEVGKDKSFEIEVINKLPFVNYTYSIKKIVTDIEEITSPNLKATVQDSLDDEKEIANECESLKEKVLNLYDSDDESKLANGITKLQIKYFQSNCSHTPLTNFKQDSRFTIPPFKVKRGEEYIVTIYRPLEDGTVKTWNYKLKGPARGTWDVSYGFTFGINAFTKEHSYHLEGSDSSYSIKKSGSSDLMNLIPSVFFTWKNNPNNTFSWGWSGGLGINSDSPSVFLGPSVTYNRNISLTGGIAVYKVQDLRRKYEIGQVVTELLDDDQLHEEIYRPNLFVTLTFRFDQSPFSSGD